MSEKGKKKWQLWKKNGVAASRLRTRLERINNKPRTICNIFVFYDTFTSQFVNVKHFKALSDRRKLYVAEYGQQYFTASIFAAKNTMRARMDMNSCSHLKIEYNHILIHREIFWIQHRNLYKSIEFEDYASTHFHIPHWHESSLWGNILTRKFEAFRVIMSMENLTGGLRNR